VTSPSHFYDTKKHQQFNLGLFHSNHIPFELDRNSETTAPTLLEMTTTAVKFLQKNNKKGYFLAVSTLYKFLAKLGTNNIEK